MTPLYRWPSFSWLLIGGPGCYLASRLSGDDLWWDLTGMILGALVWFALMVASYALEREEHGMRWPVSGTESPRSAEPGPSGIRTPPSSAERRTGR